MCWAIPARIIEVDGQIGRVELAGVVREVGLQLIADGRVGDYVLVHAGFALQKIEQPQAAELLRLWQEIGEEGGARGEVR